MLPAMKLMQACDGVRRYMPGSNPRTIAVLWGVMAVFAAIYKGRLDMHLNNFRIFRHVFFHLRDGLSLYAYYPEEYFDHNLYGPLFGVLVAPFALLPPVVGLIVWELTMCAILWWVCLLYTSDAADEL